MIMKNFLNEKKFDKFSKYPVVVLIPSLNPDENLLGIVEDILKEGFTDVIVVNDGSRQECINIFESVSHLKGCIVLTHACNKGKGMALKTGFEYYLQNFDLDKYVGIVTADADGQHLSADIYAVANKLLICTRGGGCIVLGSRDFDNPIVPPKSKNGNKLTTKIFKILFGKKIADTQTGLRGLSNQFLRVCLNISGERFEYEIKMLVEAVKNSVEIYEVPIATVYLNQNRETHFRPVVDSLKIYGVMLASFLKFTYIGLLSVAIDQGLFAIIYHSVKIPDWNMIFLSTVFARIVSSLFNFWANKNYVFCSKQKFGLEFIKYYILCVIRMLFSALFVDKLFAIIEIDPVFIKVVLEFLLFVVCYKLEQDWVFGGKK